MRQILLATAFMALAPFAYAQSTPGNTGNMAPSNAPAMAGAPAASSAAPTSSPSSGENCGTPDAFKPCPPLPRHPLAYYPGDRPSKQ